MLIKTMTTTTLQEKKGVCSAFCTCANVTVDQEQITDIENFVWSKIGKPKLPDEWFKYLNPHAGYKCEYENFSIFVKIKVFFSKTETLKKINEILSIKQISDMTKTKLLEMKEKLTNEISKMEKTKIYSNHAALSIEIRPLSDFTKRILTPSIIEKIPENNKEISSILDFAKKIFKMPAKLTTCTTFHYDARNFKPVGGLLLPTQLPTSAETSSKIGIAQLYGLKLRLLDSKIGIEEVEIIQRKKYLKITTQGSFQLNEMDRLMAKAFEVSSSYSDLLVVGN